ncbi:MAG: class 1 fructose-bisphosphatase [Bacteroidetes bacterium]|nr:class 1 fructose-bisphosphatase [Bacteroidota bacterium]
MKTLVEFIQEQQAHIPNATGEFSRLMNDIGIAAKYVNREVNKAGLADILGFEGHQNVQGEDQVKLDVFANSHFINALEHGAQCCAMASEENEELITFENSYSNRGKYVVAIDPIDGSSNVDVNVPIGTIFSIYRRKSESGPGTIIDLLQPGSQMVAAGYVMYGSSTIMVYSAGQGVNAFTYEPSLGMFLLSHTNLRYPKDGTIYSINEANYIYFSEGVKRYIKYCQEDDKSTNRPYMTRYIGSLVSDFHRNLIRGGIFIYPGTKKNPNGKLRLLYECNPMAYMAEQAGGMATDGMRRILDLQPESLHQRTPIFIGSRNMVSKASEFIENFG